MPRDDVIVGVGGTVAMTTLVGIFANARNALPYALRLGITQMTVSVDGSRLWASVHSTEGHVGPFLSFLVQNGVYPYLQYTPGKPVSYLLSLTPEPKPTAFRDVAEIEDATSAGTAYRISLDGRAQFCIDISWIADSNVTQIATTMTGDVRICVSPDCQPPSGAIAVPDTSAAMMAVDDTANSDRAVGGVIDNNPINQALDDDDGGDAPSDRRNWCMAIM